MLFTNKPNWALQVSFGYDLGSSLITSRDAWRCPGHKGDELY